MKLDIKFDDKLVRDKLGLIHKALLSPKEPLENTSKELMEYFGETVFNRQGGAKKWKPLAPSTLIARGKRTGYYKNNPQQRGKTLVWTGRLRNSFNKKLARRSLVISNNSPYFKNHQMGLNKIPKRQILSADKYVKLVTLKNFEKFFNKITS